MGLAPKKMPLKKRDVTDADIWADATRRRCVKAMVEWLKETINTQRPIKSLSLGEAECMVEAVISTWIVAASERMRDAPEAEDVKKLKTILI
jgi:hypothetical protein